MPETSSGNGSGQVQGLIVDYVGVLDVDDEDARRWRDLFKVVREEGVATAILSNDEGGPAADHIREWEFRGVVDAVVLSGEVGAEKPERAAFQAAADAIDVPLEKCTMIDDNISNVHGAIEYGMIGILHTAFDRTVVEIQSLLGIEGEF
ncbi:HAD-IA family hydrolase [Corynebacterium aquatimens]|nr:HAD-IA family hydrolase [Corynebacterium aquatimens]WJY66506.1 D-glucose-1-phosphatase [Corynebacterium aquatimens]